MPRPRVLHLIHHLRIGGAESLLVDLLPRLADAGFDVRVGCLDDRGAGFETLQNQGIPAHFIGRRNGFDPRAIWRLTRLLRSQRIEILNTHSFSAGFWGRIAALLARTPRIVTTVHTVAGWSQPRKQRLGNRLLRPWTDRIVAVSECVRRSLVAKGTPDRLIEVIPNGLQSDRFQRSPDRLAARLRLGLPPELPLIGLIGRCSPEKGGADWIRAIARLDRGGGETRGIVVGEGPSLAAWKALAAVEGVANRVRFVGAQADIVPWLDALDVLACPSRQESFGLAALEAQAAGVPVVATRVDGFLEVLHDGTDAVLVEPGNPIALAGAICAVLGSDALARRLASAGRLNAARYPIAHTAERYAGMYRQLLQEPRAPR